MLSFGPKDVEILELTLTMTCNKQCTTPAAKQVSSRQASLTYHE